MNVCVRCEYLFKKPDSQSNSSIFHYDQLNYENIVCRFKASVDKLRQPQFGDLFFTVSIQYLLILLVNGFFLSLSLSKQTHLPRLLIAKKKF